MLLPLTRFRNTACQTDPEPKVSVATQFCHYMVSVGTQTSYSPSTRCAATQLSYNTLKQHVRSKGGYESHALLLKDGHILTAGPCWSVEELQVLD